MDIEFRETPKLFGLFHIVSLLIIVIGNLLLYRCLKNKDESFLVKLLHCCGLAMMISEIGKQFFCYYYVFDRRLNLWFFPWQLCSMGMYCSFLVSYLKGRKQETLLVFLATFNLLAAVMALLLPSDMLRPQILLTVHGFLYHGLMISLSLMAIIILRGREGLSFKGALFLFGGMALIAQLINVLAHLLLHDIHREPDMFYITPYYESTQPFFHEIALRWGILAEVLIYLCAIAGGSYLLYCLLIGKRPSKR